MSALGIAAIIALPFVFEQVEAFGNASDMEGFPPTVQASERPEPAGDTTDADQPVRRAPAKRRATANADKSAGVDLSAKDSIVVAAPTETTEPSRAVAQAGTQNDWGVDPKTLLKDASASVIFEGDLARRKSDPAPRWSSAKFIPSRSGAHEFTLDWSGDGNLKIALFEAKSRNEIAARKNRDSPKASLKGAFIRRNGLAATEGRPRLSRAAECCNRGG